MSCFSSLSASSLLVSLAGSEALSWVGAFGAEEAGARAGADAAGGGVGAGGGGRSSKSEDLLVRRRRATATAPARTTVTASVAFWLDVILESVDMAGSV